jgi:hypothetical protein
VIWSEGRKVDAAILGKTIVPDAASTAQSLVLKRETSDEVLRFLYPTFSQSLRAQILAKNPEPMTLTVVRSDKTLKAKWRRFGVKVRPDGSLDSILQPSAGPAFDVEFIK